MTLPAHDVPDTRTRILEATAQCIADDGIAAVRMATIAKAAGVSTALLHYHFATKEHLFESVLRYSYESTTVLDQAPSDRTLNNPIGLAFDGRHLYVSDHDNRRILRYTLNLP